MLLVFFITKRESVSINIVCKRKNILSNTTYINWVWVMNTLSKKANNTTVLEFVFCFSVHNRFIFIHSLFFVLFTLSFSSFLFHFYINITVYHGIRALELLILWPLTSEFWLYSHPLHKILVHLLMCLSAIWYIASLILFFKTLVFYYFAEHYNLQFSAFSYILKWWLALNFRLFNLLSLLCFLQSLLL